MSGSVRVRAAVGLAAALMVGGAACKSKHGITDRDPCGACIVSKNGKHFAVKMSGSDGATATSLTLRLECPEAVTATITRSFVAGRSFLAETNLTCSGDVRSATFEWGGCTSPFGCSSASAGTVGERFLPSASGASRSPSVGTVGEPIAPRAARASLDGKKSLGSKDPCGACTISADSTQILVEAEPSNGHSFEYTDPTVVFHISNNQIEEVSASYTSGSPTLESEEELELRVDPPNLEPGETFTKRELYWNRSECANGECARGPSDRHVLTPM